MQGSVPHEVVNLSFDRGVSAMAAWREHLGLTQAEVAARIGITQAAYAQMERVKQAAAQGNAGEGRVGAGAGGRATAVVIESGSHPDEMA